MDKIRKADDGAVREAAEIIRGGGLVAFGTETVYGLGGNALDGIAVARIFSVKARPGFNPLICHLPDRAAAFDLSGIAVTPLAENLARHFWPGPMTLVLEAGGDCPVHDLCRAGLPSVALRVPGAETARRFLDAAGVPVAAPSANRSGRISPTNAVHAMEEIGHADDVNMILDCGACEAGIESTVIDARAAAPRILRPGSVTADDILKATGIEVVSGDDAEIISPGQMESHYAPTTPLKINAENADDDDVRIGFGNSPVPQNCKPVFNLSPTGNLIEAAANLYSILREADSLGAAGIAVAPIPMEGIGIAINDRLRRAAKG